MPLSERKKPDPLSKSQVKRDMLALQKLGEELVALPDVQLAKLPLPAELREAIQHAQTLKADESLRRQRQYIGKLMREIDPLPLKEAMEKIRLEQRRNVSKFHQIETWRDQLIAEGDEALQKFLEAYPQVDRQHLRQLVRNAQQDVAKNKNTGAASELFKYLRERVVDSAS